MTKKSFALVAAIATLLVTTGSATLLPAVAQTDTTPYPATTTDVESNNYDPNSPDYERDLPDTATGCINYLNEPEVRYYLLDQWNQFFSYVLPTVNEARAESGLAPIDNPRDRADDLYRTRVIEVLCRE